MSGKEFTGHIRAMRADNDWFGAEDLVGLDDVPFRIERVEHDPDLKIGGTKSKDKFYLVLSDSAGRTCHKRMLINAGRRKMLGALYGGTVADWKGKWVWCYVDEVKSPSGGTTLGMKFRNRKDAPKSSQQRPARPAESDPLADYRDQLGRSTTEQEARDVYNRCADPNTSNWTGEQDLQMARDRDLRIAEINGGAK